MAAKLAHGILPALCTPFDDSGQDVAAQRVPPLVGHLLEVGSTGFFVCGSTGEGAALSVPERQRMAEAVVGAVARAAPVIVQVGATTSDNAVVLARHAAACGADAVASVVPVDRPNDLAAAVEHYAAIGAATDLPFYAYWIAQTADRRVTAEQYLEAMQRVPNFAGVKFTDTNFFLFEGLVDLSAGRLNMISGPDEMCLAGMVMGSDAAIGTTYNVMPRLFVAMRRAFEAGDVRRAMELQVRANRVIRFLVRTGAVLAAVKALLAWRGLPVGPTRPPQPALCPAGEAVLRRGLETLGFEVA
ncbi:MAG: dihydrodipicolinate synthase family protein [Candidatus Latescibacterota bacterium]